MSYRKSVIFLVFIFLYLQCLDGLSYACDCAGAPSPGTALEQSDSVFSGKITEQKDGGMVQQGNSWSYRQPSYVFTVKKFWKGVSSPVVEVIPGPGNCGYYGFEVGKEYLVYARGKETLEVSQCGRTKPLGETPIELMILDAVQRGEKEEDILKKLLALLIQDPDEFIRAEAAQLLARYAPQETVVGALPNFIQALSDKSPRVRRSALAAFEWRPWIHADEDSQKIGKAVIAALGDSTPEIRRDAARLLSRHRFVPETESALQAALQTERSASNSSQEVIRAISSTLATIGTRQSKKDVIPLLVADLGNENSGVRWNAAQKLGEIGREAQEAVKPLLTALHDGDEFLRYGAAEALGRIESKEAIPDLVKALKDQKLDVRSQAALAIYNIGDEENLKQHAIPVLIESLSEHKGFSSYHTIRVLGEMGPIAYEAVPALSAILGTPDGRYGVADALGKIGPQAKSAIPSLLVALKNDDSSMRVAAAAALGEIDDRSDSVIQGLMSGLKDVDPYVRWVSAGILHRWNIPGALPYIKDELVPSLVKDLKSDNLEQKREAASRLGQFGSDAQEAIPDLVVALSDKDSWVRQYSATSLGMMGPQAEVAIPKLVPLLDAPETRMAVIEVLGSLGSKAGEYVPQILSYLKDENEHTRYIAAEALRKIGTPEAKNAFQKFSSQEIPRLVKWLKDTNSLNRGEAARYLTHLAPETKIAITDLVHSLRTDPDWLARTKSAEALGALGPSAQVAISDLESALNDRNAYVREAAAEALKKINRPEALRQVVPNDVELSTLHKKRLDEVKAIVKKIRLGMTRAQIEEWFKHQDGGIQGLSVTRYYEAPMVMVDVPFDQIGGHWSKENRVNGPVRVYKDYEHFD